MDFLFWRLRKLLAGDLVQHFKRLLGKCEVMSSILPKIVGGRYSGVGLNVGVGKQSIPYRTGTVLVQSERAWGRPTGGHRWLRLLRELTAPGMLSFCRLCDKSMSIFLPIPLTQWCLLKLLVSEVIFHSAADFLRHSDDVVAERSIFNFRRCLMRHSQVQSLATCNLLSTDTARNRKR